MDLGERYEHIEYFLESFREYWEDKCPGMNFLSVLRSLDLEIYDFTCLEDDEILRMIQKKSDD